MTVNNNITKKIILTGVCILLPFFVSAQTSAPSNTPNASFDPTGGNKCSVCGATPKQIESFLQLSRETL